MREAVDELAKLPTPFLGAFLKRGATRSTETALPGEGPRFRDLHPWLQAHVREQVERRRKEVLGRLKEMRDRANLDGTHNGEPWDEPTMGAARDLVRLANSPWASADVGRARSRLREQFLKAAPRDARWDKAADKWAEAVRHYGGVGEPLGGNRWLGPCPIPIPGPVTVDELRAVEAAIAEDFGEAPLEGWKAGLTPPQLELVKRQEDREAVDAAFRKRDGRARPAFADALLNLDAIADLPDPEPLLEGVLYRDTLALLVAPPWTGKSLWLLHLGLAAACGQPMHGRPTAKSRVLLIAAEGKSGLKGRIAAAREAWTYAPAAGDFQVLPEQPNLGDRKDVEELAALITKGRFDLVIVDTLNKTAGDLNENDATAMGQYVAGLRRLVRDVAGATVIVAHHTTKGGAEQYRGSSALLGAADTVLQMAGDRAALKLEVSKQKDGMGGLVGHYAIKPAHGSAVMEGILRSTAEETLRSGASNADQALDLFHDTFSATGATKAEYVHMLEQVGIPKASAYRAINDLVQRMALTQDERTKRLTLTPTLD